jgi:excisionase family DNA binding protein
MAQKFTSLDDAANSLGISKDRLNQLREAGKVRGYRDGSSWKFRADEIEKFASEGVPTIDPEPSDLSLDLDEPLRLDDTDETEQPKASADDATSAAANSGLELDLADDEAPASPPSDLNLEEVDEPTVAADVEDEASPAGEKVEEPSDVLALDDDEDISLADSILLSEAELGAASNRPPSTIIGKADLDLNSDLDLALGDSDMAGSDVKLAPGSDILSAGSGEDLALEIEPPSPSGEFEGLPEVDIDLEAESSRILAPEDVAKAKGAAEAAASGATSDLELAPTDSDAGGASEVNLGGEPAAGSGLTGLSALELEDDDDVLGEGSDVTLSSESSGINIISPSDSGLALDEVALDLAGSSPIGSALDLGEISEAGVSGVDVSGAESKAGEDFQLTPLGEDAEEEDKDSSQVIALDEVAEEEAVGAPLGGGDSQILAEDFGAVALTPGAASVVDASETSFSTANVVMLGCCMVLLVGCGMLAYDLVRNMWIWSDVSTPSSFLLEAVNPFIK